MLRYKILLSIIPFCFAFFFNMLYAQEVEMRCDTSKSLIGLYENWDSGFVKNNWIHECEYWQINQEEGNPAPCAYFHTETNEINYSCILESDDIYLNSEIFGLNFRFEFDFKLQNINPTQTENLVIQLWELNQLFFQDTLSNAFNTNWIHYNQGFNYSPSGLPITIKFIATGGNSENITAWLIDNIQLRKCSPVPHHLRAKVEGDEQFNIVTLDWDINLHPGGGEAIYYHDGTFENGFACVLEGGCGINQLFNIEDFSQVSYPFYIYKVRYFNDDYGNYDQEELVYVLSGDGNEILSGPYSIVNAPAGDWVSLNVDVVQINSGNFMVATINKFANGPFIGADNENPFYLTLYAGTLDDWYVFSTMGTCCYVGSHEAIIYSGPWEQPTRYNVYRKFPGEGFVKINNTLVDNSNYTDTIPHNTFCAYYVTGLYEGCESDSSNNVIIDPIMHVEKNSAYSDKLIIHPNPASDEIELILPEACSLNCIVTIYDISGRKVKITEFDKKEKAILSIADIKNGLYILELKTRNEVYSGKLMISH